MKADRLGLRELLAGVPCTFEDRKATDANGLSGARQALLASEKRLEARIFVEVSDALSTVPTDAVNMMARSNLLTALQRTIAGWDVTQDTAAKRLGITRPRISDLVSGKVSKFSLDALFNLASQAGLLVELRVSEAS